MENDNLKKKWSNEIRFFDYSEFDSPDLKESGLMMNFEFVKILDSLRKICKFPLLISSGFRTKAHNSSLRGSIPDSAHLEGVAVDIIINDSRRRGILIESALNLGINRIGIDDIFIHLDIDNTKPPHVIWLYSRKS